MTPGCCTLVLFVNTGKGKFHGVMWRLGLPKQYLGRTGEETHTDRSSSCGGVGEWDGEDCGKSSDVFRDFCDVSSLSENKTGGKSQV